MTNKLIKKIMPVMFAALFFCTFCMTANATQTEETTEETTAETEVEGEDEEPTPLTFEIAIYTYEMLTDATQEDMPTGFTIGDWEYNGVAVKAGFTENSDMICVMGEDWETGYQYRFIYDPNHDMFVPYFGAEIKDGYIYTIPMYEETEEPYGFVESYFVIQTVPMFTYMRSDAELTQEEIAVGSLSEDNYLVFLMMDENGKEVHYTYDLIDRTFQRALLQKKDAEKVTELNEVIDELHADIGELNAINAERMNKRLTIIGILVAVLLILAGVIVNLLLKISKLKHDGLLEQEGVEGEEDDDEYEDAYEDYTVETYDNQTDAEAGEESEEEDYSEEDDDEYEAYDEKPKGILGFFMKKRVFYDEDYKELAEEERLSKETDIEEVNTKKADAEDDDLEILNLDLDDL